MILDQLLVDHPGIFGRFMDRSTSVALILVDNEYRIIDCSSSLVMVLHLGEKPLGWPLNNIFHPLETETEISMTLSSPGDDYPVPGIFRLRNTNVLYRCYAFETDAGILVLGDHFESTESEVLDSMSLLNNELSLLTRELAKKNRQLEDANRKITDLMRADPLTGLANRRYFQERFDEALSLARRKNSTLSVIMADLDHFKSVNDTWGHDKGDLVLREFAALIRENCRQEDLPVRFGGEEFLLLLPQTTASDAVVLAERIRIALEKRDILGNQSTLTASIGVGELGLSDSRDSLLKRVDDALYRAKNEGRNRVVQG